MLHSLVASKEAGGYIYIYIYISLYIYIYMYMYKSIIPETVIAL